MKVDLKYILSIYTLLIIQIGITISIIYYLKYKNIPIENFSKSYKFLFLMLLSIPVILMLSLNIPKVLKLMLLTCLSIIFGVMIYPSTINVDNNLLLNVFLMTVGIFIGLSVLTFYIVAKGYNLSGMRNYLFAALIGLIIAGLILLFYRNSRLYATYLVIGAVIFSLYIMYDTNNIIKKRLDVINSTVNFYLDFVNLFLYIFQMYNQNK